jgi:ABC-2 type transport system ATP-binding protein
MEDYICAESLFRYCGLKAVVKDVSLNVRKGEVVAFLGPNGAGKTTTMRMLSGYLKPSSGFVSICGCDMLKDRLLASQHVGYLPEGCPLYHEVTPLHFLKFVGKIRGLSGIRFRNRLDFVVERLRLESVLGRTIGQLSKGFQHRVALAQAILHDPEVLILDEPTDGLDPLQKYEVRGLIRDIAPDKGILISTHMLDEAEMLAHRVVLIGNGIVHADDFLHNLLKQDSSNNAVFLEVAGVTCAILTKELQTLSSVLQVVPCAGLESGEGSFSVTVYPVNSQNSIVREVSNFINDKGWELHHVTVLSGSLANVFNKIVTHNADFGMVSTSVLDSATENKA